MQFSSLGIGFTEALENTHKDRLLKPPKRVRSTPDALCVYSNQTHTEAPDEQLRGGRALQERGDRTHRSSPRTRGFGAPAGSTSPRPQRPEGLGRREHGLHSPFCLRDGVRFPARENKPTAPSPHRGSPRPLPQGAAPAAAASAREGERVATSSTASLPARRHRPTPRGRFISPQPRVSRYPPPTYPRPEAAPGPAAPLRHPSPRAGPLRAGRGRQRAPSAGAAAPARVPAAGRVRRRSQSRPGG